MSHNQMMSRVEMMAKGNQKWDLSPNDVEALKYVLCRVKDLEMVCDNRGRREEEQRSRVRALEHVVLSCQEIIDGGGRIEAVGAMLATAMVGPSPSVTNEQTSGGEKDVVASVPAPGTSASFANHAPARGPEEAGSFIDHGVTRHASDMICPRCPSDSVSDECECPPEGHMLGCKRDRLEPLKQRASEAMRDTEANMMIEGLFDANVKLDAIREERNKLRDYARLVFPLVEGVREIFVKHYPSGSDPNQDEPRRRMATLVRLACNLRDLSATHEDLSRAAWGIPDASDVIVPCTNEAFPDVHARLTYLVDENFGTRPTMPTEELLTILEEEVPKVRRLAAEHEECAEPCSDKAKKDDVVERLAKWIVNLRIETWTILDHACARCRPTSSCLVEGFTCAYHLAHDIVMPRPETATNKP
jgi:hypothetical protein